MQHLEPIARRMHRLVEPISLVTFFSDEPNDALMALGFRNYWDGYFAGTGGTAGSCPGRGGSCCLLQLRRR